MLQELKDKIEHLKKSSAHMFANDSFSFFRLYVFITSPVGQRRILHFIWRVIKYIFRKLTGTPKNNDSDYVIWMRRNFPTPKRLDKYLKVQKAFSYNPKISILLPVYNPDIIYLKDAIDSVRQQLYPNWELCIADDYSENEDIKKLIDSYVEQDARIKVVYRKTNGHISVSSNTALSLATGEFIALLDHDDCLSADALFHNVKYLNGYTETDLIYSDEDKLDASNNHTQPYFKPDWCPDSFLSRNYIGHLVVIRKSIVDSVGGFREGYEGAQDYDLLLRVTEQARHIHHIPRILYHWRMHAKSTAVNEEAKPYAFLNGIHALEDTLQRRGIQGAVTLIDGLPGFYHIDYHCFKPGKVSVIIPTKNKPDLCEVILHSIFTRTQYPDFEVILINNNSDEPEFFDMVSRWEQQEPERFSCLHDNDVFNFSRLMNQGASKAKGEYLLLLNNDTEVLHADWMLHMVKYAQFERIGVVGVQLLYPNRSIQHAGVVIGLGGIAGHTFVAMDENESGYFHTNKCVNNYSALTAACILIRKEVFNKVGGFEEALAIEFNDIDFSLKVKEAGYDNVYLPHVKLLHYESISRGHPHKTRKAYKRHLLDVKYFKNKWQSYIDYDPCYSPHLTKVFTDFRLNVRDRM